MQKNYKNTQSTQGIQYDKSTPIPWFSILFLLVTSYYDFGQVAGDLQGPPFLRTNGSGNDPDLESQTHLQKDETAK